MCSSRRIWPTFERSAPVSHMRQQTGRNLPNPSRHSSSTAPQTSDYTSRSKETWSVSWKIWRSPNIRFRSIARLPAIGADGVCADQKPQQVMMDELSQVEFVIEADAAVCN